jgi:3-hydroxyacyl-CoA dehydrogenase
MKVAVIGCGLIGRAWANVFARAGAAVNVWDPVDAVRATAHGLIADSLHDLARHGLVSSPAEAAGRVTVCDTLEAAVAGVEHVQENGPENLDIKRDLFARMDRAAPQDAVLASSTSFIVASKFSEGLPGRHRCLVAHPVNPPHVVPIVELAGAPWTSPEVVARSRALFEKVGQVPVEVKREIDGFILNRMQAVLLSEAMRLVGEGYCTAEDLDKTIAHGLGLRWSFMGPFETIELNAPGGIPDYCQRYGEALYRQSSRPVEKAVWEQPNVARVVADWGKSPTPAEIAEKSRWRDDRLAALIAHKRTQKTPRG